MHSSSEKLNDAMSRAHRLAVAGDLAGAAALCRRILAQAPRHFYALFMLGSIEAQAGRSAEAEALLSRALAVNPQSVEAATVYGDVLSGLERHAEAVEALSRALKLQPNNLNALIYRGIALAALERREDALADFGAALRQDPRSVFALHNRANVLIALGRANDAAPDIARVLALAPDFVPGIANRATLLLGQRLYEHALAEISRGLRLDAKNPGLWRLRAQALSGLGRHEEAVAASAKALELSATAETLLSHGNTLLAAARHAEAAAALDCAVAAKPDFAEAHLSRANALMELERLDDALAAAATALEARPGYAAAHLLRGNILLHLRRESESLASYEAAVTADPAFADAYYHRGSARLLTGDMHEGWRDFEHRWNAEDCGFNRPALRAPEWRGEPLSGRSLIVYSEQGLGDTIQFARFLPRLTAMGARVTFLCHPNLRRLFKTLASDMETIAACDPARPFHFQCALMSLPLHLGIGLDDLPGRVPYLAPEIERAAQWRARLGEEGFTVGISWQGNPKGKIDRGRSIPLAEFAPLAAIPGVRLISVQKTHGLDQLARVPAGMRVETLGAFDEDGDALVDTAAIMESLDLIVTSDTATAHLAGALARPVWVALQSVPDWRWMLDREDSPWYPTMRLFRQRARGDWKGIFARMAHALATAAGETK
jgi:tetratricopeptide (TPR) repeat protein